MINHYIKNKNQFKRWYKISFPSAIICPFCKNQINLTRGVKGYPETQEIQAIRVKVPVYLPTKIAETSLEVSICGHCKTVLGIGKKM